MPGGHGTGAGFLAGVRYYSLLSNAHNIQQHIQPPPQTNEKMRLFTPGNLQCDMI